MPKEIPKIAKNYWCQLRIQPSIPQIQQYDTHCATFLKTNWANPHKFPNIINQVLILRRPAKQTGAPGASTRPPPGTKDSVLSARSNRKAPKKKQHERSGQPSQDRASLPTKAIRMAGSEEPAEVGEGKEWRPLDWTSPAQAPQEHIFGSPPRLSLPAYLSLLSGREGVYQGRRGRGGYGISPSREYASGLRPQELLPRLHQRLSLLSLSLSPLFFPRVCVSLGCGVFWGENEIRWNTWTQLKIKWENRDFIHFIYVIRK